MDLLDAIYKPVICSILRSVVKVECIFQQIIYLFYIAIFSSC